MNFFHTAQALRESTSIASGVETYQGWTSVYASFACLVEPMPAFRQVTFFGVVSGGVFCVTWGDETLHEGDRIVWNGRTFTLKLSVDDRYRGTDTSIEPYQTGVLTEDVLSRG